MKRNEAIQKIADAMRNDQILAMGPVTARRLAAVALSECERLGMVPPLKWDSEEFDAKAKK